MSTWNHAGPVVVEVDASAENLRVVDYASAEALRSGSELVLVAPYSAHGSFSPMLAGYSPMSPAELADTAVRTALTHVRQRGGPAIQPAAMTGEGARNRVLMQAAPNPRMLVVGRSRSRGPERLVHTQANLTLAARAGFPVVVVPMSWKPSPADRKVAVGIDGTSLSSEAVEFAFGIAAVRGADLIIVHAGVPAEHAPGDRDAEHAWICRADHLLSETLDPWTSHYPDVKVTRFLSSREPAAALVHESLDVGLVVVGSHIGRLPIDPVARRSVAAMTCPVAIVPHHPTDAEWERLQAEGRQGEFVVPT